MQQPPAWSKIYSDYLYAKGSLSPLPLHPYHPLHCMLLNLIQPAFLCTDYEEIMKLFAASLGGTTLVVEQGHFALFIVLNLSGLSVEIKRVAVA